MGGGKRTNTSATRLSGISVQSSVYGTAIPRGWGTFRVSANMLWYGDFQAIAVTTKTKTGGKGGGGTNSSTTYSYKAALILGICAGPIEAIRTVFKDKSVFTGAGALSQVGLSVMTGEEGQAVWGHLTTQHPDQAIGYSGLAYAYASAYQLSDSATVTNHSFEVVMPDRVAGSDDANPKTIVEDLLASVPGWPSGVIGDLTDYGDYCLAEGLLLSPVMTEQRQASEWLTEFLRATNSEAFSSEGKLKIKPYGDTEVTGNGVTWTPDLTPLYDLTLDDFVPPSEGDDPLTFDLKRPEDAYNRVEVVYLNRDHQYNEATEPGVDQASIDQFGERKADPVKLHSICDTAVAIKVADLLVRRVSGVRTTYKFRLPWNYVLLDPMDLVTVTDLEQGIDRVLVRITDITESDDEFEVEAEEMLVGRAAPALITRQTPGGYRPNLDVAPGDVSTPIFINPPRALTGGAFEVWIAASGGDNWGGAEVWVSLDGDTYELQGRIEGPARYGVTTSTLAGLDFAPPDPPEEGEEPPYVARTAPPATGYPHPAASVGLNLTASGGELTGGTDAERDALATLSVIGEEFVSFRDATLTGVNRYTIANMRRGLFGSGLEYDDDDNLTAVVSHAAGSPFVRLDGAVYEFPYREDQIGDTIKIKFRSFNVHGRAYQELDEVDVYTIILSPNGALYVPFTWTDIGDIPRGPGDLTDDGDIRGRNVRLLNGETLEEFYARLAGLTDVIDDLGDDADETIRRLFEIVPSLDDVLEGVLRLSREAVDIRRRTERLLHLDAIPIGTVMVQEQNARQEGDAQIVETIDLIGVVTGDGSGFVLNAGSVRIGPTELLVDRFSGIGASLGTLGVGLSEEVTARINADLLEIAAREALGLQVGELVDGLYEVEAGLAEERIIRYEDDQLEITARLALAGRIGEVEVGLTDETQLRLDGDGFNLTQIEALQGRMGDAEGAIVDVSQLVTELDAFTATRFGYLGVARPGGAGWVLNETQVQVGTRGTIAQILTDLNAEDAAAQARITSEVSAITGPDGAIASAITAYSTVVGSNYASIVYVNTVRDGLEARAALVLNVNGRITGYEIDGTIGQFVVAAEYFAVAQQSGGTPRLPFVINGTKIGFSGDVELDGGLLVTGTVTTTRIAADNITIIDAVSTGTLYTGNGSNFTVLTYTLTLPLAAKVILMSTARHNYPASQERAWSYGLYANGGFVTGSGGEGFGTDSIACSGFTALPAGTHTITAIWNGEDSQIRLADANITIMAVFR